MTIRLYDYKYITLELYTAYIHIIFSLLGTADQEILPCLFSTGSLAELSWKSSKQDYTVALSRLVHPLLVCQGSHLKPV